MKKSAKFILKEPTSENETLIYLIYRDGFRLKYSIRQKIHPENWNKSAQRMREVRGLPYRNFNALLDKIERRFYDIILELKNEGKYTQANLMKELDFYFQIKQDVTLVTYLENFVENKRSQGVYKQYKSVRTLKNLLVLFNQETGADVNFNAITEQFFSKFTAWLTKRKRVLKNGSTVTYSINYIAKMACNIRIMMNHARRDGHHRQQDYEKIKRVEEDVYKVYLTDSELRKLIDAKLEPMYANARDIFIIGCFTAMRVGNYGKLNADIQVDRETGYIQTVVNKNGPRVLIPIHSEVAKILFRPEGPPHNISEDKLNDYIKIACKKAGINSKIIWSRTEGGRRVEHVNEKWELVTTHTARRTFCTNAVLAGIPIYEVMMISGHNTVRSFLRYIRVRQEEVAQRLKEHEFFTGVKILPSSNSSQIQSQLQGLPSFQGLSLS